MMNCIPIKTFKRNLKYYLMSHSSTLKVLHHILTRSVSIEYGPRST